MTASERRKELTWIEKLHALRVAIDEGLQELDEGRGIVLDIEQLIREKHAKHRKA